MTIIRPITDLRNTNAISELCHRSNDPVFITKNGYGDMVIMSMEAYETMTAQLQTAAAAPPLGFALPQPVAPTAQNSAVPAAPVPRAAICQQPAVNFADSATGKESEESAGEEDFGGLRAIREKYRKSKTGPAAL